MTWTEFLDNPESIRGLFPEAPQLTHCGVKEVAFHHDGPRVTIAFDIKDFPAAPPSRWRRDNANTVQIKLQLIEVEQVLLDRWTGDNQAAIEITRVGEELIRFTARGDNVNIVMVARFLRLERISAYQNTPELSA